jgi:hypothetical protein
MIYEHVEDNHRVGQRLRISVLELAEMNPDGAQLATSRSLFLYTRSLLHLYAQLVNNWQYQCQFICSASSNDAHTQHAHTHVHT